MLGVPRRGKRHRLVLTGFPSAPRFSLRGIQLIVNNKHDELTKCKANGNLLYTRTICCQTVLDTCILQLTNAFSHLFHDSCYTHTLHFNEKRGIQQLFQLKETTFKSQAFYNIACVLQAIYVSSEYLSFSSSSL